MSRASWDHQCLSDPAAVIWLMRIQALHTDTSIRSHFKACVCVNTLSPSPRSFAFHIISATALISEHSYVATPGPRASCLILIHWAFWVITSLPSSRKWAKGTCQQLEALATQTQSLSFTLCLLLISLLALPGWVNCMCVCLASAEFYSSPNWPRNERKEEEEKKCVWGERERERPNKPPGKSEKYWTSQVEFQEKVHQTYWTAGNSFI